MAAGRASLSLQVEGLDQEQARGEYRAALPRHEVVLAASPSNAWVSGMRAALEVALADVEGGGERTRAACELYRRGLARFEKLDDGTRAERQAAFDRARTQTAACAQASLR